MAQLAITVAGMGIGAYFGQPQLGAAIGALAGAGLDWLMAPSGRPHIQDKAIQVSAYGQRIPRVYGTARISGVLGWWGGLAAHKASVGGGKGLSQSATTYNYTCSFQIILCEGPIAGIGRVWGDGKLIIDYRAGAINTTANVRGADIVLYRGTETQMPDPTIAAWNQGYAPGYRGVAYLLINHLQLADFANRAPNITVEVIESGDTSNPYDTVTSPVEMGGQPLIIDDDRGYVYDVYAGNVTKIDAPSATVVRTTNNLNSGVGEGGSVVGTDGYIYAIEGPARYEVLVRIDPGSLQVVDSIGTISAWTGIVPWIGHLTARNGFIVGWNAEGAFTTPNLTLFTEPGGVFGFEMACSNNPDNGNAPPYLIDWATLDDEGNLWAVARDGSGHPHLLRYVLSVADASQTVLYQITSTALSLLLGGPLTSFFALALSGLAVSLALQEDNDLSASLTDTGSSVAIAVDDNDGMLLIGRGDSFIKWDPIAGAVGKPQINVGYAISPDDGDLSSWTRGVVDGIFCKGIPLDRFLIFDAGAWQVRELIPSPTLGAALYDRNEGSIWTRAQSNAYTAYEVFFDRIAPNEAPLSSIVASICQRAGLTSGQYDVSSLTGVSVRGFVDTRAGATGRDLIQILATAFFFDAVEADYQIKFVLRGSAPIAALTADDIGAYESSQTRPEPLQITLPLESELPVRVWVHHIDPGIDYQPNVQPSKRITHATLLEAMKEQAVELPIVLTPDEAGVIADKILYLAWTVRQFAFAVSRAWLALDPANVITLQVTYPDTGDTVTYVVRLVQEDLGANGVIQMQAELEDPSLYIDSESAGGGPSGWQPPIMQAISPTLINFMDIPALRDQDATAAGYYIAAGPLKDGQIWSGCLVLKSIDRGQSFENFETITDESIQGVAITALPTPRAWTTWDRVNSVSVLPNANGDLLASVSEEQVLNGANVALLGDEIIQFAEVTQNDDGSYTLSTLLRGRRGSDPFVGAHAIGDRFVVLTPTTTMRVTDPSELDLARTYKAVSIGESTFPENAFSFTDTGASLMPLTACSIEGSRDGSANLTITWLRQTRIGGDNDWADGVPDVPLGEASESYQVDIIKAGAAVRTIATTSESAAYTAADQTTDFGSPQSALDLVIYQMSAVVGRGFGEAATV